MSLTLGIPATSTPLGATVKRVAEHCWKRSDNHKNKRFAASKDNVPENIGCMCGQNNLCVNFICVYRRGMIYHVPPLQSRRNVCRIVFGGFRNVINHAPSADACRLFYAMLKPNADSQYLFAATGAETTRSGLLRKNHVILFSGVFPCAPQQR